MTQKLYTQADFDRAAQLMEAVEYDRKRRKSESVYRGYKHDATFNGAVGQYAYGNGGLFSTPGQEPTVFSTIVQPLPGIANALPVQPQGSAVPEDVNYGGYLSPFFTTITGLTEGSGSEMVELCDDAPLAGLFKKCTLTATFGRYARRFRVELSTLDQLSHRGQPTDLRLVQPLAENNAPFNMPSRTPSGMGDAFKLDFARRFTAAGIDMQRLMCSQVWAGTPTNNSAGGGYMEFSGLDTFIAAGNKVDAINGTPCPSMDSDIKNFGYDLVNGAGRDIVQYVDMMYHFLLHNSRTMNLEPTEWVIVMRSELFDEIVKVWPVRYYQEALLQMANFANGRVTVSGAETTNFRDDMRNGFYLPIRGKRIPVITDDCIAELAGPGGNENLADGQYASDIYFVPMTVLGGAFPVTYWEYNAWRNVGDIQQFLGPMGNHTQTWAEDGGQFLFAWKQTYTCFDFQFYVRPRIIMRTPFLAGRIQNVAYEPLQHTREPLPSDAYFVNGGATNTPQESVYTEWSTTTPVVIGQPGGQY